ncbi:MAG: hypothetical protein ACR2HH_15565 [Chthoniobacterales bacterium]
MINPNGDDFTKHDPVAGSMKPAGEAISSGSARFQEMSEKVSTVASDTWRQTKERASTARERTEFFMRENPVPTVLGALALGLAIGLAIRYSSEAEEREVKVKSPLGNVDLSVLSLPFLWPFLKNVQRRYEDSADVVRDRVSDGVDRLRKVDVDDYVKPLRKKWRAWTK